MNRRDVLQKFSCLLGLTALQPVWGRERPKWKVAIGLNGFSSGERKYGETYPIWEILDFASHNGFDGVELVDGWPQGGYPDHEDTARLNALRRLYEGYGLQIFSLQLGAGGAFSAESETRSRWGRMFEDHARLAKDLGCDCIGLWPGGPIGSQTIDQAIDRLCESFRRVGDIAAEQGLLAAFEIEPPFVFNTEDHLRRILDGADHPNLRTIFDPSHFDLMNGSTGRPHEMLERIGVENIGYVHLTDTDGTLRDGGTSKHLPCGDGHVDMESALATLLKGGFEGWVMIDAWEVPDPYEASLAGKRAVKKALG